MGGLSVSAFQVCCQNSEIRETENGHSSGASMIHVLLSDLSTVCNSCRVDMVHQHQSTAEPTFAQSHR
jgi:DNA-binding ferritin-like protein